MTMRMSNIPTEYSNKNQIISNQHTQEILVIKVQKKIQTCHIDITHCIQIVQNKI